MASNPTSPNRSPRSSASSSPDDHHSPRIHAPSPRRPAFPERKDSGPIVVSRDSVEITQAQPHIPPPDDVRAMSPRRNSEEVQAIGKEARDELRRQAQALQGSLLTIFQRIEAVKEEHDKLDNNNKFLQKYIGDLMSTSKITATGSRGKK